MADFDQSVDRLAWVGLEKLLKFATPRKAMEETVEDWERKLLNDILNSRLYQWSRPLRILRSIQLKLYSSIGAKVKSSLRKLFIWVFYKFPIPKGLRKFLQRILQKFWKKHLSYESQEAKLSSIDSSGTHFIKLSKVTEDLARHSEKYGAFSHIFLVPFFDKGGSNVYCQNLTMAISKKMKKHSILIVSTDNSARQKGLDFAENVFLLDFVSIFGSNIDLKQKTAFLNYLLGFTSAQVVHNINSEAAWEMSTSLANENFKYFVSTFAFQFDENGDEINGYANRYLKRHLPQVRGVITDNNRFQQDCSKKWNLTLEDRNKFHIVKSPGQVISSKSTLQSRIRQDLGTLTKIRVAWAGRISSDKNLPLLRSIISHNTNVDFYIFGNIDASTSHDFLDLPNAYYEGAFSDPREIVEHHSFDAFLFTSNWEGLPNILVEMGRLGIPVIASNVGGVSELISESTGYLFSNKDGWRGFSEQLDLVLRDGIQSRLKTESLKKLIEDKHSINAMLESLENVPEYFPHHQLKNGSVSSDLKVSVIIPCFNQTEFLWDSLKSVRNACRDSKLEVIVVDDGSTENRAERNFSKIQYFFPEVKIVRQANKGLSCARNRGMEEATGDFIQFLDADDILFPRKIDTQILAFLQDENLDVCVSDYFLSDSKMSKLNGSGSNIASFGLNLMNILFYWERGLSIPIHCGLFRSLVVKENSFNEELCAKEDWIFWAKVLDLSQKSLYQPIPMVVYRQHEGSMRRDWKKMGDSWLKAGSFLNGIYGSRFQDFEKSFLKWFNDFYSPRIGTLREERLTPFESAAKSERDIQGDINRLIGQVTHKLKNLEKQNIRYSILIPIFQNYSFLVDCIESAIDAADPETEIVVRNDGSSDPRISELLCSLEGKSNRLVVIDSSKNIGISENQNVLLRHSRGTWLFFLDCDDLISPEAILTFKTYLQENPEGDYFFSNYKEFGETKNVMRFLQSRIGAESKNEEIRSLLALNMIATHLKIIKREVFERYGGFDSNWEGIQDYEFALRVCNYTHFVHIPKVLYKYRIHSGAESRNERQRLIGMSNILKERFNHSREKDPRNPLNRKVIESRAV